MMSDRIRQIRRAAGYILALAILLFLGRMLHQTWGELATSGFHFTLALPQLIASLALLVVAQCLAVESWRRVLLALDESVGFPLAFRLWFFSNLARFVPGNVWQVATLVVLAQQYGLNKAKALLSQAIYITISLAIAGVLGLLLLFAIPEALTVGLVPAALRLLVRAPLINAVLMGGLIFFLALPPVYRLSAGLTARLTNHQVVASSPPLARGLMPPLLSSFMWLTQGIAFYLFVGSMADVALLQLPAFIVMNAGAYFVGYVSFLTPSGLGFREGALAWMLSLYFPMPVALALSLATRLWVTAGEFLGAVLLFWPHGDAGGNR